MTLVVLVASSNQQRDADALRASGLLIQALDLSTGKWLAAGEAYAAPHAAKPRYVAAAMADLRLALARRKLSGLITGQDTGPVQRAVLKLAKNMGIPTVLLPDGVASAPSGGPPESSGLAARTLAKTGLSLPPAQHLGSSRPDIVLSWGPGWRSHWERPAQTQCRQHYDRKSASGRTVTHPSRTRSLVRVSGANISGATGQSAAAPVGNAAGVSRSAARFTGPGARPTL